MADAYSDGLAVYDALRCGDDYRQDDDVGFPRTDLPPQQRTELFR